MRPSTTRLFCNSMAAAMTPLAGRHSGGGLRRAWIIADMDATLVDRPPSGLFPTLAESPCLQPLLEWLRLGGGVCVVTTAARRSITQVWDCLPSELRANRQVVLSALEGGDLVYGGVDGEMVQDDEYLEVAAEGGGPTCFRGAALASLFGYAESMIKAIFNDMLSDRSILEALSDKYQKTFGAVLDRLASGESEASVLSREALTEAGAIMTVTKERLFSFNTPVMLERLDQKDVFDVLDANEESKKRNHDGSVSGNAGGSRWPPLRVCTISVMGFPAAYSKPYYEPFIPLAAASGAKLSGAPNSLWFTPVGVGKATPVRWLTQRADAFMFDIANAIAFGDCPHSNDFPLTRLPLALNGVSACTVPEQDPETYCPFVSVAHEENASCVPPHAQSMHVGGLEFGTARVIQGLVDAVKAHPDIAAAGGDRPALSITSLLPAVVQACQQVAKMGERDKAIDGREV